MAGRNNKGRKFPVEVLAIEEYVALLNAAGPPHLTSSLRNRALLAILYGAGLRVSEALKLYPKDLDLAAGSIRVLFGKGSGKGYKARTVGIDLDNVELVKDWLARRDELGLGPLAPLLCTYSAPRPGQPLDASHVRRLLPKLALRAGITKRVHAHGLRHSLAAQLDDEHVATRLVKDQLGHNNIQTTSGYLENIKPRQVLETMRGRRPLGQALESVRRPKEDR